MSNISTRVAARYIQAVELENQILDTVVEQAVNNEVLVTEMAEYLAEHFLDELVKLTAFDGQDVESAFQQVGIEAEDLNKLLPGHKQADVGQTIQALGGWVIKSLWHIIAGPFVAIGKTIKSEKFRHEIKQAFVRALKHEVRSTRHMFKVVSRLARGEEVNEHEKRAALHQMIDILTKLVVIYFAGPHIAELFSGGIWRAFVALLSPIDEIVIILLDKPLRAVAKKLLSADLGLLPSGFYTHFA